MSEKGLPKTYDFKETEERVYAWWRENKFFKPCNDPNAPDFDPNIPPYVIAIPPPNVTGELHLGHALFVSMEDLMIRYQRMNKKSALWVPGTDHAGIATQLQVEITLVEEGLTREEIGREEFQKRVWAWKEKFGGIITEQIRRLGASCDWDRERFTLDNGLSRAVREAFVRLYEKGLIYRGPRLINWSPGLKTAVSDLEVEYFEEPGTLYYFKYMLSDSQDEYIPVATTRPETILGDTAVAVHPDDERYRAFAGREVLVPILNRKIPVILDDYVDLEFGTGALKVTPGHDPNDYEIGQRHKLEIISVLDEEAYVNDNGGPYAGLDRFEARSALWKDMGQAGLVLKEEPYTLDLPRTQRGGEIVEPMISTQWFVKAGPLAEAALEVVRDGRITIVPEHFTKVYYNWLENIRDWCISRQLWWGHRIPVWYGPDGDQFCARTEEEAYLQAREKYGEEVKLEQDPDVLDTWFSSGLWPFSTLGWPEETPDYRYFYPTTMMETGYDILFFWVARMIMMGLEFTGKIPFETVYLHGLIRDERGRKMSKSTGNMIDPLDVMDEYGTDALRFTLLVGSTPGKDTNVSIDKVKANRNFANKLWNAGRFIIGALETVPHEQPQDEDWTLADSWIWARLQTLIRSVDRLFKSHHYGEAGQQIYEFIWSEFADWYIEIAKLQLNAGGDRSYTTASTLVRIMDLVLRLLHPFTPFVTEEIWTHLKAAAQAHSENLGPKDGWPEALIVADWPQPRPQEEWEAHKEKDFKVIQEVVRVIRNLRADKKVKQGMRIPAIIVAGERIKTFEQQASSIASLAHLDPKGLTIHQSLDKKPDGHVALVAGQIEIYLPLSGLVDSEEERKRLEKSLTETLSQIDRLEELLSGPFTKKAPEDVIAKERVKLDEYKERAEKIKAQLKGLD